jgi:predicted tellurium resistance membrane protein TerC
MELFTPENAIALLTLTALEVVLGIDNLVVISILTGKLPPEQRARARRVGLLAAMGMRIGLLLSLSWIIGLSAPLFTILERGVTGRDLILLAGGLFLIAKATHEIHTKIEAPSEHGQAEAKVLASFGAVVGQIMLFDLVFSIDSVITAIGMARAIPVMVAAIVIAVVTMMIFAGPVSDFVERHPSIKMLALSFLLLIGVLLLAEGMGAHLDRGYVYFAMGFSLFVEMLNLRAHARRVQATTA